MKSTGVVICNYNKSSYIINCIQSVLESKSRDFDIFVIDNASTDDSVSQIKSHFQQDEVTLIVNPLNLGGSGGFNTGIHLVVSRGYKYVWCLDNDTLVDENAFIELKKVLEHDSTVGMVGSKIYHMQNPDLVQQFGITVDFTHFCVEANYLNEFEDGSMPHIVYSDAVAACSVLVRASLIQEIGAMPEENFLYWDDTEWGILCNQAGYKVASVGSSKVLHEMGAKKEEVNTFATYYAWRNWIVFFLKYAAPSDLENMCDTFLKSIFEVVYTSKFKGEFNKVKTIMAAYDDAIHLHMGKADADRIFVLDKNDDKLMQFATAHKTIHIVAGKHAAFATRVKDKLLSFQPNASIEIIELKDDESNLRELHQMHSTNDVTILRICPLIFDLDDLSCKDSYIDYDFNLFTTKEDALWIINYLYSREIFLFSQKSLFLRLAKEARLSHHSLDPSQKEVDIYS